MQIELNAYESKVNLALFNDIVAFVLDTAEATRAQRAALFQRCPFLYHQSSQFQEKYQFLYLGELLERYEERFGMSLQDLRAIALALGFTKDFTIREMFVGSQKEDFLKKVQRSADCDIYLISALYLLGEGQSGMTEREQKLTNVNYDSTEEKYKELLDGTFSSVIKFLDTYRYYQEQADIARRTVRENLDGLLKTKSYELDSQEAVRFLCVCNRLVNENAMGFTEAQKYISKIKECGEHGT